VPRTCRPKANLHADWWPISLLSQWIYRLVRSLNSTALMQWELPCTRSHMSSKRDTVDVAVIDNCSPGVCNHGSCSSVPGGYICTCDPGYTGGDCSTGKVTFRVYQLLSIDVLLSERRIKMNGSAIRFDRILAPRFGRTEIGWLRGH
jgi:EGF-like domain